MNSIARFKRQGFSLLEVSFVMALSLILLSMGYAYHQETHQRMRARLFLERLALDLQQAKVQARLESKPLTLAPLESSAQNWLKGYALKNETQTLFVRELVGNSHFEVSLSHPQDRLLITALGHIHQNGHFDYVDGRHKVLARLILWRGQTRLVGNPV